MKQVFVAITVLFISTSVSAFDFLGPPKADTGQSIGIEYLQGEMNLDVDGAFGLADAEIEDVEFTIINGIIRSRVTSNMELFVRLGMAEAEVDPGANADNLGYYIGDSDNEFAIGAGAKITLLEKDAINWGITGQISYADLEFDGASGTILGLPASLEASVELLGIQIAAGPTIEIKDNIYIYGGAMAHLVFGWADLTGTIGPDSGSRTSDLEQDSLLGGFVGGQLKITNRTDVTIEYQTTGDSHALGISLMHRFGETTKITESNPVPKIQTDSAGKKIKGYKGTINPTTGKPEKTPIYEDDEK